MIHSVLVCFDLVLFYVLYLIRADHVTFLNHQVYDSVPFQALDTNTEYRTSAGRMMDSYLLVASSVSRS